MSDRPDEPSSPRIVGLASLIRRRRLVALCGGAFLLAGLLAAVLRPPMFTASTQLLVYTRELHPGPESVVAPGAADVALVQNQIEIIRSPSTLRRVVRALNLTDDPEFVAAGRLFDRRAVTADADRIKTERAIATLDKTLAVARVGLSHTIRVSVTTANPALSARIANEIVRNAPQQGASEDTGVSRGMLLRERLQGLGPSIYVMSKAEPPVRPNGPRKILIIGGALALGLAVGGALALLLDFRDRTIRTAGQVGSLGLECLGPVPRLADRRAPAAAGEGGGRGAGDPGSWALAHPGSLPWQTLRRAETAILAADARRVGVTSTAGADGATTVALNLAHLLARTGRKVLFVGAGRAAPAAGDARSGLHVLAIDAATAWSAAADKAVADAADAYDHVIVDLPPLACTSEFRTSAQKLHGLLLVLKWGGTELEQARQFLELAGEARRKFIGAILNMVDERLIGTYGDKLWEAEAGLAARRHAGAASAAGGRADPVPADIGRGS